MFAVAVVGPYGFGPILNGMPVTTSSNPKAPPKKIQVKCDQEDPLRMIISWQPSCTSSDESSYTVSWFIEVDCVQVGQKSS